MKKEEELRALRLRINGKGVSGKVLTLVATLLIGFVALIFLWLFLTDTYPLVVKDVENMIAGFKKMFCSSLPAGISNICSWISGA